MLRRRLKDEIARVDGADAPRSNTRLPFVDHYCVVGAMATDVILVRIGIDEGANPNSRPRWNR